MIEGLVIYLTCSGVASMLAIVFIQGTGHN